jgi:23S rRNA (cytosine1962-C5)-methyltransferase
MLYTVRMALPAYELLDFGNEQRLERWGPYTLARPDPTAFFEPVHPALWEKADAAYEGEKGKGEWVMEKEIPESWPVQFGDVKMNVKLAPYKHTGVFPEQEQNWRWTREVSAGKKLNVLNLFAYTGGATMALAKDGHFMTHVDSSKPAITWAKENAVLNELSPTSVRWILEDAALFVSREVKRGKKYDAIILDPPAFGHGPTGKAWRADRDLAPLLEDCAKLLGENPVFIVLNGYAQNDYHDSFQQLLGGVLRRHAPHTRFDIDAQELELKASDGRMLSTGIVARCLFR